MERMSICLSVGGLVSWVRVIKIPDDSGYWILGYGWWVIAIIRKWIVKQVCENTRSNCVTDLTQIRAINYIKIRRGISKSLRPIMK